MQTEQQQLLASFPGFIDTIETMFPEFDTHIMVANPDGTWPGWGCEKYLCENDAPYCGENGKDYVCGPASYELVTTATRSSARACSSTRAPMPPTPRARWPAATATSPAMSPTRWPPSSASPRVGTYGYPPPIGDALIAALSPYLSVGECNKGFLRDDALLFLTFISDTEDEKSKTTPTDWYKAIVKAKHGDPGAVVTLLVTPQYAPEGYPADGRWRTTRTSCAT
jgi:hypothetical protein